MLDLNAWLYSLLVVLAISVLTWLVSLVRKDVSIVDSLWSLMRDANDCVGRDLGDSLVRLYHRAQSR